MKLSNKATLSLRLLSKCSFTISKLRFIELRKPKISGLLVKIVDKIGAMN